MNQQRGSIRGGQEIGGVVTISGAKNAALPILAGCLITRGQILLKNFPKITDTVQKLKALEVTGLKYEWISNGLSLDTRNLIYSDILDEITSKIRTSSLLVAALLARFGKAKISMPGGCKIGNRPIDLHLIRSLFL